ncbi:unnamed protein product [Peniophora sp. CBMAI 1063]|nr:unnamed protein product [Peniophora sp. CBMAI 1063]
MGSDAAWQSCRSEILSTTIALGPPALWIMINPDDLHDLLAQVFAGVEIDLDAFCALCGPTPKERDQNVTGDPYAAAMFFHFLVQTCFTALFGTEVLSGGRIKSEEGFFGYVSGYYATVEAHKPSEDNFKEVCDTTLRNVGRTKQLYKSIIAHCLCID